MKFQEIDATLAQFASANGGEVLVRADGTLGRMSLLVRGEIEVTLWLALYRRNSRSPAYLKPRLSLYCARLSNQPVDAAFLQSLEGVPKVQADALIEGRQRENGHVFSSLLREDLSSIASFAEAGPLTQWTHAHLVEYLSGLLMAATQLAEQSSWPNQAEEFLVWVRAQISGRPWLSKLAESWSVAPKA